MYRRLRCVAVACALAASFPPTPAPAAVQRPAGFAATRADHPLPLDPTFADAAWASAFSNDGFVDLGTRVTATAETSVAVLYDDTNLYIGFRMKQSTPAIASQRTNDVGFGADDFVGVGVDTAGNGEHSYYFLTTPLGTRYQFSQETSRYTPVWQSAAATTPAGWNAMLVVPLRVMHLGQNGPQHWKINFIRAMVGTNEHDSWAWTPLMGDNTIPNWPSFFDARYWRPLSGMSLSGVAERPRPRAEIYGLGSTGGGREQFVDPNGNAITRSPRVAGVDLAYPITPTIAAVGAIDPDFSNVEIDQQTIAPQQFQRNLTEYRPFFAQGAPYVNTARDGFQWNLAQDRLFFSPSLGVLDRGFKIEGTSGIRSFGVLEAKGDDGPDGGSFDDVAWGLLHRRETNTLALWADGVMAHHDNGNDDSMEIGGFGRSLASGLVYAAQYGREQGTFVRDPSQAQAFRGFVDIQKPGFEGAISYNDIGPQYHPVDGFTNLADIRGPNAFFDWVRTFSPNSHVKNVELFFNADRWVDRSGEVHAADADYFLNIRTTHAQRYVLGDSVGSLRSYQGDLYSSYDAGNILGYTDAVEQPFVLKDVEAHFGEGEPRSFGLTDQWGPFGTFELNSVDASAGLALGKSRTLSFDYAGTREMPFVGGFVDNQWLRRISYAMPFGPGGVFNIAYRDISGTGGFASPGHNVSLGIDRKFKNQSELFVDFGTPAASKTVNRLLLKYLIRLNGGI